MPYNTTTCLYSITNIKPGAEVTAEQLKQCRDLFSSAYGMWSSQGRHPYKPVTISTRKLKLDYLFDPKTCGLVVAKDSIEGGLVGQALYVKYRPYSMDKEVIWITQLVVREEHRHKGVATALIRKCLMDYRDDVWACGLVSCHPYAVKALETATKSRCNRSLSAQHAQGLIQSSGIPYVQNCQPCISTPNVPSKRSFMWIMGSLTGSLPTWKIGN